MNEPGIKLLSKPNLNNPAFILGLSDEYGISEVVVQTLIEHTRSEKFAEFYSPYFPDYIDIDETGLCNLPKLELYASEKYMPNTVIISGEVRPDIEDSQAHYEVFNQLLSFAKDLQCKLFLSFGCFQVEGAEDRIYVAATTGKLVSRVTKKLGGKPLINGIIDGPLGITLGLSKIQAFPAICILNATTPDTYSQDAQTIFHYLLEVLKLSPE